MHDDDEASVPVHVPPVPGNVPPLNEKGAESPEPPIVLAVKLPLLLRVKTLS